MTGSFFFNFFFLLQDLFLLRVIEIVYASTSAQSDQKKANKVKSYLSFFILLQLRELSVPSVFPFAFFKPLPCLLSFFFSPPSNHSFWAEALKEGNDRTLFQVILQKGL